MAVWEASDLSQLKAFEEENRKLKKFLPILVYKTWH